MVGGEYILYIAYGLTGVATFIFARMLFREEEARAAQENLEDGKDRVSKNALVRLTRPIFSQTVVPIIRSKKFWDNRRTIYRRKLISAGLKEELSPDEFIAFKLVLIAFFPIAGGVLRSLGLLDLPMIAILSAGVIGWFYPDLWVNARIKERHKQIQKTLPFVVDLLALSTEAGLDFIGAIGKVVEKAMSGPLVNELEQLLKEIKVGASRSEAMREMALRINLREVNSLVAVLISADQMGAAIGQVLRQQSEAIRNERFVRAEKAGAMAAQKLLIPLVFIIMPAVILMVLGPFVLGLSQGGGAF